MRVVSGGRLRPPRTKHPPLIDPSQTVAHHQQSQIPVCQLVLPNREEPRPVIEGSDSEVKIVLAWQSYDGGSEHNIKIHDFVCLDGEAAAVTESQVETVSIVFDDVESDGIGLALPRHRLVGVEAALNHREDFVEVSRVELEETVAPVLARELAIQKPLGYRPPKHILIQVETDIFLDPPKQSKYNAQYFSSRGISGTFLLPHCQLLAFSTCSSLLEINPIFSTSTVTGLRMKEMVTFFLSLPGTQL